MPGAAPPRPTSWGVAAPPGETRPPQAAATDGPAPLAAAGRPRHERPLCRVTAQLRPEGHGASAGRCPRGFPRRKPAPGAGAPLMDASSSSSSGSRGLQRPRHHHARCAMGTPAGHAPHTQQELKTPRGRSGEGKATPRNSRGPVRCTKAPLCAPFLSKGLSRSEPPCLLSQTDFRHPREDFPEILHLCVPISPRTVMALIQPLVSLYVCFSSR